MNVPGGKTIWKGQRRRSFSWSASVAISVTVVMMGLFLVACGSEAPGSVSSGGSSDGSNGYR